MATNIKIVLNSSPNLSAVPESGVPPVLAQYFVQNNQNITQWTQQAEKAIRTLISTISDLQDRVTKLEAK